MVKCKDLRKHVIQLQWEHKKMEMQIEDLNNKARDIRKLKLNEEQKDVSAVQIMTLSFILTILSFACFFSALIMILKHWL